MKKKHITEPSAPAPSTDRGSATHELPIRDWELALRVAGGNSDLADEMFEQLCQEIPTQLSNIQTQAAAEDWDELVTTAHRLHGSTAVCGVPALNDVIGRLERSARAKNSQELESLLELLDQEVARLLSPIS